MKENLNDHLLALERPDGKKQRRLFKRKRGGQELTREQVRAIKKGRKLLRKELKEKGLTTREDFELTASSLGLYLDKSRSRIWWRWLFFGRGLWALLGALLLLLGAIFGLAVVAQLRGHFTINMSSQMFQEGFILSETADFSNATTHLFCTPTESVPCVSISHIPPDIDEVDGQHNDAYFAYTFYIKNAGASTVAFEWMVGLISESRTLTDALWVMVFEDGEMMFYAKPSQEGGPEAVPGFGDNSRGYPDLRLMHLCKDEPGQFQLMEERMGFSYHRIIPVPFESEDVVARGTQTEVKPGDIHKYTVVIWLEGDDPDCTDELVGGHAGMAFDFRLITDSHGDDGDTTPQYSFWEDLWNKLIFWD